MKSSISPAVSTPLNPAPPTTNVSSAARSAGSSSRSARSSTSMIRLRRANASASVFMPTAYSVMPGIPNVAVSPPRAITRLS